MKQRMTVGILVAILPLIIRVDVTANEVRNQTTVITNGPVADHPHVVWSVNDGRVLGEKDTNGWSCVLAVDNIPKFSSQQPPVCKVYIKNISTNVIRCWGGAEFETYTTIQLHNAMGEAVQQTLRGRQNGTRTDGKEIQEMVNSRFKEWVAGRSRTTGFVRVRPGNDLQASFSIPDLFVLKQPGEYSLKVQTCLIRAVGGQNYDPKLEITLLPEVVAKIHIFERGTR